MFDLLPSDLRRLEYHLKEADMILSCGGAQDNAMREDVRRALQIVACTNRSRKEEAEGRTLVSVTSGEYASTAFSRASSVKNTEAKLEVRISIYEQLISKIEHEHRKLQERRQGANDSVMIAVEEMLLSNRQTLGSLNRFLANAKQQLEDERARARRG